MFDKNDNDAHKNDANDAAANDDDDSCNQSTWYHRMNHVSFMPRNFGKQQQQPTIAAMIVAAATAIMACRCY